MPPVSWLPRKELGVIGDDLDSQAFTSPSADVDGFELAALYPLQHGLSRHTEPQPRLEHRQVAGRCVLDEASPQLIGHANTPGSARGQLLADDNAGDEPAVQRGGRDPEDFSRFLDGDQFAIGGRGRRGTARDAAVSAQATHLVRGETLAAGGASLLVNLSNDGWYRGHGGAEQHFAHVVFRAVETRLPLVRSTSTGISAIVDARGEVLDQLGAGRSGTLEGVVPGGPGSPSLYVRLGDSFALSCGAIWLAAALWALAGGKFVSSTR